MELLNDASSLKLLHELGNETVTVVQLRLPVYTGSQGTLALPYHIVLQFFILNVRLILGESKECTAVNKILSGHHQCQITERNQRFWNHLCPIIRDLM